MVLTPSIMIALGTRAPDFSLPDTAGTAVSLADFADARLLLVAFLCSHCDYTRHIRKGLAAFARDYAPRGLASVGINANDDTYRADRPELMAAEREEAGYPFPYLFDAEQSVAAAYSAACTPDLFLFDAERRLAYRGQFDDSRPGRDTPVTGADLRRAADALLSGAAPAAEQKPSIGCNIKWRPKTAPSYFKPGALYWMIRRLQRL